MQTKLSEILINTIGVAEKDINEAQRMNADRSSRIGETLVAQKIITETQLLKALSLQYDIPLWIELPLDNFEIDFTQQIPIQFLKKYIMVPLISDRPVAADSRESAENRQHPYTVVAVNDPACIHPLDDLVRVLKLKTFQIVLSTKQAILSAINTSYDLGRDSAEQLVQDMEENGSSIISEIEETADLLDDISDAPIIKLVNHITQVSHP